MGDTKPLCNHLNTKQTAVSEDGFVVSSFVRQCVACGCVIGLRIWDDRKQDYADEAILQGSVRILPEQPVVS